MARRDGTSSRHSRGRLRSDDPTYEYDKPDNGYARRRRSPSRSQSRASRTSDHSDRRASRTSDHESHSPSDSTDDDTSSDGEASCRSASRSASRGRRASTTSRSAPSIRSVKSPRAALNRFNTNIRRSPVPASPDLSRDYTTPKGRAPLPPDWTPQFSTRHGRWYYYNKATGKSQWEAPGFEKERRGILLNKADGGGRIRVDGGGTDGHGGKGGSRGGGRGSSAGGGGGGGGGDQRGRLRGGMGGSGSHTYAEPHRKHGGLGTAGLLLSVAGGIAAGTLLARALQSKKSRLSTSESTVRRTTSCSSFSD